MRLPFTVPVLMLALGRQGLPPPPPPPPQVQQPARDPARRPPPDPKGTSIIRGRVVTADSGSPVRHANVALVAAPPPLQSAPAGRGQTPAPNPVSTQTVVVNGITTQVTVPLMISRKTTVTDAQGMFEFKELPAGTYRLTASPGNYAGQYLGIAYGAKKPNGPMSSDPGQPITLVDGQAFTAAIALPRGAVISGHVTDENGEPLARVQVYTLYFPPGATRAMRTGGNASTDDLGQYRLFGLPPGDYEVVAEARNNSYVAPNAPPETEEERVGMMTTYYPGTPDEGAAQRVRARDTGETSGIEIRMASGRMFHISGMVVDSQGKTSTRANGSLMYRVGASNSTNSFGFSTDQEGRFQMRSIPPGDYRLIARLQPVRLPDSTAPPDPGEFAVIPLSLNGDVDNLLITTKPGATITGQVALDGPPPTVMPGQNATSIVRISAQQPDPQNYMGMPMPPPVTASAADQTFTFKGLMGELLLRANAPGQYLKSIAAGGEDITDTPHEFKQGERVTITMTTRVGTLEGTITDDKGQPATDAALMMFGEDKASWRSNSIRTRRNGADQTGHFKMTGVLPGRYFIIAVPRERLNAMNFGSVDPAFFEQLAKEATSVTVGEDEQRQIDLKVTAGAGG